MIIAEIVPQNDHLFFVRFSEPNEDFTYKPFFCVTSLQEAKRRMYFRNRMYILEKLNAWLKQRDHALSASHQQIYHLTVWLKEIENRGFIYICDSIKIRRKLIEELAPHHTSRCYNHYSKVILPILDFCSTGEHLDQ
jgi:hypothetical protein